MLNDLRYYLRLNSSSFHYSLNDMFGRNKFVFHMKSAAVRNVKHMHNSEKFIVSRKLFENDRFNQWNHKTKEPDSTLASKLSAYHELLDVNNDGVVSIEDLSELTKRFSKINNMTEIETAKFSKIIKNLWYKHWGCIDPFDYVTVEKYLNYIQYIKQNECLRNEVVQLLPYLFKTVDKDQSGIITQEEYETFLKCIGKSKKDDIIRSLGIINDNENTIKLDDLMLVVDKYLFHNKDENND